MKAFLAVLTTVMGAAAGGTVMSSFTGTHTSSTFLVSADPSTLSIVQGNSMSTIITVTSINGFIGTVALSVYYPNGGSFTSTFVPTSVNVAANSVAKSTLTISLGPTASLGNFTVDILATSGKKVSATSIMVDVRSNQDFIVSVQPSTINNVPGSTDQATVSVTSMNGFTGTVQLQATVPFGYITVTGGQGSVTLQAGQTITSSLTVSTSTLTALGNYSIVITGTSGILSSSATVTLVVSDPVVINESLVMTGYSFNSNTNMTLNIQNTGSTSVTLQSYSVLDSSGDSWTYTYSNNAPVIASGGTASVYIVIGMGCNGCAYTGITGLFNQFTSGQTYTVTLTTMASHQFSWAVTR